MSPRGKSPLGDLRTMAAFRRELRAVRPIAFLGFTAKPNIYGSLAAHSLGIPVINNISGLGAVFTRSGPLTRIVSGLYKLALRALIESLNNIARRAPAARIDPREIREFDFRMSIAVQSLLFKAGFANFVLLERPSTQFPIEDAFDLKLRQIRGVAEALYEAGED